MTVASKAIRRQSLPATQLGSWALAWPAKGPLDVLDYTLDLATWLADAGLGLQSVVSVLADPTLTVGEPVLSPTPSPTAVTVVIGGGVAGSTSAVAMVLALTNGERLEVAINLPVVARAPAGLTIPAPPAGSNPATAALLLAVQALPTTPPTQPGQLWVNGGLLCVS